MIFDYFCDIDTFIFVPTILSENVYTLRDAEKLVLLSLKGMNLETITNNMRTNL